MPLGSFAPVFTPGVLGNLITPRQLAPGESVTTDVFHLESHRHPATIMSKVPNGSAQVGTNGGSLTSEISGVRVTALRRTDDGQLVPVAIPFGPPMVVPTVANTQESIIFDLGPGDYSIACENIDPAHSVEVWATLAKTN